MRESCQTPNGKAIQRPNSQIDRIQYWARQKARGSSSAAYARRSDDAASRAVTRTQSNQLNGPDGVAIGSAGGDASAISPSGNIGSEKKDSSETTTSAKPNVATRFYLTFKDIILSSWINVLLVFVPVGIAAHFAKLSAGIVFAMNAIAIIPLAGLLSHATESVASRMGDTVGALMNVTFGNAVELIIL